MSKTMFALPLWMCEEQSTEKDRFVRNKKEREKLTILNPF